jgi:thioesterase domain-containing protein
LLGWYREAFAVGAGDRMTQLANLGFDAAALEIWPALTTGAQLFLVDEEVRLSPTALIPWLIRQSITVCFLPTPLAEMVVNRPWPDRTALRLLLTGGDQLHRVALDRLPFTLVNLYGPTENTVVTTWTPLSPEPAPEEIARLPSIGRPLANVEVYVLNEAGEPQPVGVAGELSIGGQSLSPGYLHYPALTAARFMPDPYSGRVGARLYRTGDLVRYLPDGRLEFLGRRDHQVKVRGYRIELGEIEALLASYPGVHEAVVVVSEALSAEKRLVAYLVSEEGEQPAKDRLQRYLKERLPEYMIPMAFSFLEALPLTVRGKVDRQELARRRPLLAADLQSYVAPRDALELQLARLWERLLGVAPIGVSENFFQLGGHSLAGVRLMSQIQRIFGPDLPLSVLFEGGTIASLAAVLRQQEAQITQNPLVEIQAGGDLPPLFCVHPSGGDVLCYMEVARQLGADQPVYGLRATPLTHPETGPASLEALATLYLEAIVALRPQGPYYLSGWSMGGVLAFEMARQLEERGAQVAFLGLLDSHLPPSQLADAQTLLASFIGDLVGMADLPFATAAPAGTPVPDIDTQLRTLLLSAQQASVLPSGVDADYIRRLFAIFRENLRILCAYQPRPYAGQLTLLRASAFSGGEQVELTYGWRQFARDMHSYTLPGNHYTMLRSPHVEALARQLCICLREEAVAPVVQAARVSS